MEEVKEKLLAELQARGYAARFVSAARLREIEEETKLAVDKANSSRISTKGTFRL